MTSPPRGRRSARARAGAAGAAPVEQHDPKAGRAPTEPRPFTPRRALFVVLMIGFALWVAALIVMYFTAVT
jgi:hypothetical protein